MLFEFLPTEYKTRARKLYRSRLIILFTTGILFVTISSIVLLMPSYIIARIEKGLITKERDSALETLAIKENDTTKSFITSAKAKIEKADSVLKEKSFINS